jgi:outer membrane receptor protein involved in Fe transport
MNCSRSAENTKKQLESKSAILDFSGPAAARRALERYFSLDVLAARRLRHGVSAFIAIENLLNQQYEVGRTPVPTLGPPILFRVGLRFASNDNKRSD